MTSDELKNKIENLLQIFTNNITDNNLIQSIQNEYNLLMDMYSKLAIMSNEDLEGIENEITTLSGEVSKLNQEKSNLQRENDEHAKSLKKLEKKSKLEAEGLFEKIKILQNTVDSFSNKSKESEAINQKLNQSIVELKNDKNNLMNKYQTLLDEVEINNKNVKKNFTLELMIKQLTEENEKLSATIRLLNDKEDYKVKFLQAQSALKEINEKYSVLTHSFTEVNAESEKLSNENFNKFNLINSLEKEIKIKNHKIEEFEKENKSLNKVIVDLTNQLKEAEYSVKSKRSFFENQMKELKKEIDKLVKSNETSKKELWDATEQLKKYQHYTNFAKASKEILSKKDFSILETMSRRVEELSNLNESLKHNVQTLGSENEVLLKKVNSLETLVFFYMKDDITIMKNRSEDTLLPEEELIQIKEMISNPSKLIEIVYLTKKDNFSLQKEIANITIECNKLLRSASEGVYK